MGTTESAESDAQKAVSNLADEAMGLQRHLERLLPGDTRGADIEIEGMESAFERAHMAVQKLPESTKVLHRQMRALTREVRRFLREKSDICRILTFQRDSLRQLIELYSIFEEAVEESQTGLNSSERLAEFHKVIASYETQIQTQTDRILALADSIEIDERYVALEEETIQEIARRLSRTT